MTQFISDHVDFEVFLSSLVGLNLPQENAQKGHILKSVSNTLTTLKYSVNPSISIQQNDTRKK